MNLEEGEGGTCGAKLSIKRTEDKEAMMVRIGCDGIDEDRGRRCCGVVMGVWFERDVDGCRPDRDQCGVRLEGGLGLAAGRSGSIVDRDCHGREGVCAWLAWAWRNWRRGVARVGVEAGLVSE